ncbi:MAG: hypothetical protein HYS46_03880 [Betaproteobacteria bacterium]|nr:hypothetical protein [Betaproteobacteria bacterium]
MVVELPALPLTVLLLLLLPAAAGPARLTAGWRGVSPAALLRSSLPVSGGQRNLQLIQLIPFGIGPLSFWNRPQRLQAGTRGNRLRVVHGRIIASFARDALITYRDESWSRTLAFFKEQLKG